MRKILILTLLVLLLKVSFGQINCYTASNWVNHISPLNIPPGSILVSTEVPPGTYVANFTCYIYGDNESEYYIMVNTSIINESIRYVRIPTSAITESCGTSSTDKFTVSTKTTISVYAISMNTTTNVFNNMVLQVFSVNP